MAGNTPSDKTLDVYVDELRVPLSRDLFYDLSLSHGRLPGAEKSGPYEEREWCAAYTKNPEAFPMLRRYIPLLVDWRVNEPCPYSIVNLITLFGMNDDVVYKTWKFCKEDISSQPLLQKEWESQVDRLEDAIILACPDLEKDSRPEAQLLKEGISVFRNPDRLEHYLKLLFETPKKYHINYPSIIGEKVVSLEQQVASSLPTQFWIRIRAGALFSCGVAGIYLANYLFPIMPSLPAVSAVASAETTLAVASTAEAVTAVAGTSITTFLANYATFLSGVAASLYSVAHLALSEFRGPRKISLNPLNLFGLLESHTEQGVISSPNPTRDIAPYTTPNEAYLALHKQGHRITHQLTGARVDVMEAQQLPAPAPSLTLFQKKPQLPEPNLSLTADAGKQSSPKEERPMDDLGNSLVAR